MPPSLNLDILLHIAVHSSRETALALMLTCRALYAEALKVILRSIRLKSAQSVDNFVLLVSAGSPIGDDTRQRYSLVRELSLSSSFNIPRHSDLLPRFLQVLRRLTHLESMSIAKCERCFSKHPDLASAIASLPSLSHLKLSAVGSCTWNILTSLTAPHLTIISLDFSKAVRLSPMALSRGHRYASFFEVLEDSERLQYDPLQLLSKWSSSLRELRVVDWDIPTEHPPYIFSSVHRLSLSAERIGKTHTYVLAFPNVTHIALRPSRFRGPRELLYNTGMLDQLREANINDQHSACLSWAHLEELSGCLLHIYAFGPIGGVRNVQLDRFVGFLGPQYHRMLAAVLEHARPTHLSLDSDIGLFTELEHAVEAPGGLAGVLRQSGSERLESLDVSVSQAKIYGYPQEMDVPRALVGPLRSDFMMFVTHSAHCCLVVQATLAESLARLPLRRLRFEISFMISDTTFATVQQADLEAFVRAVPTLEEAYVSYVVNGSGPLEVRIP